ncbi:MAG: hypothetical protein KBT28_10835 [Bacteroidales bacterium]|nr:hypothetical protein [Candidatus Colimorpha merdihippi]
MNKGRVEIITPKMKEEALKKAHNAMGKVYMHYTLGDSYMDEAYSLLDNVGLWTQNVKHWGKACLKAFNNFSFEFSRQYLGKMGSDDWKTFNDDLDQNMKLQRDWTDGKLIVVHELEDSIIDEAVEVLRKQTDLSQDKLDGFKLGVEWAKRQYQEMSRMKDNSNQIPEGGSNEQVQ